MADDQNKPVLPDTIISKIKHESSEKNKNIEAGPSGTKQLHTTKFSLRTVPSGNKKSTSTKPVTITSATSDMEKQLAEIAENIDKKLMPEPLYTSKDGIAAIQARSMKRKLEKILSREESLCRTLKPKDSTKAAAAKQTVPIKAPLLSKTTTSIKVKDLASLTSTTSVERIKAERSGIREFKASNPAAFTRKPATFTRKPATVTNKPATVTRKPVTVTRKPATVTSNLMTPMKAGPSGTTRQTELLPTPKFSIKAGPSNIRHSSTPVIKAGPSRTGKVRASTSQTVSRKEPEKPVISTISTSLPRVTRRSIVNCTFDNLSKLHWIPENEVKNKKMVLNMLCLNDFVYKRVFYKKIQIKPNCFQFKETTCADFGKSDNVIELLSITPYVEEEEIMQQKKKMKVDNVTKSTEIYPIDPRYIDGKVNIFDLRVNRLVTYRDVWLSLLNDQPKNVLEDIVTSEAETNTKIKTASTVGEAAQPTVEGTNMKNKPEDNKKKTIVPPSVETESLHNMPYCECCLLTPEQLAEANSDSDCEMN